MLQEGNAASVRFPVSTIDTMEAQEVGEKHPAGLPMPTLRSGANDSEYPAPDEGLKAWLFLVAASFTMVITWGFSASFGIFREHYFNNPPYKGNQSVAYIGVLGTGLQLSLSVILVPYLNRQPTHRTPMLCIGAVVLVGSTLGAAFCQRPLQIIMTQGLLFGVGSGLIFAPCLKCMDGWFIKRRGVANGLFFGASSLAAAIISPVSSITLNKYGIRNTLLGWSIFSAIILAVAIPCIHPRVPVARTDTNIPKKQSHYGFFLRPVFWLLALSTGLQGMGHTLLIVYLPSYATDLGYSTAKGALLITFFQIACIFGQPGMGALADKVGPLSPLLLITIGTSLSTFLLWGLSTQYWSMVLLAILFGIFSGSFIILRSFFATRIVQGTDKEIFASQDLLVSSLLLLIRGMTTIASGFAGKAVVESGDGIGIQPGYGAGKWKLLIIYVGAMIGAASLGAFAFIGRPGILKKDKANEEEAV